LPPRSRRHGVRPSARRRREGRIHAPHLALREPRSQKPHHGRLVGRDAFLDVRPKRIDILRRIFLEQQRPHVEECIAAVQAELAFRARVVAAYEAIRSEGLSFPADKAAVMRLLAPRFTKGEMRRVYAALAAAAG
jgi:hypothetical protein